MNVFVNVRDSIMFLAIKLANNIRDVRWIPYIAIEETKVNKSFPSSMPNTNSGLNNQVDARVAFLFDQEWRFVFFIFKFLFGMYFLEFFAFFFDGFALIQEGDQVVWLFTHVFDSQSEFTPVFFSTSRLGVVI